MGRSFENTGMDHRLPIGSITLEGGSFQLLELKVGTGNELEEEGVWSPEDDLGDMGMAPFAIRFWEVEGRAKGAIGNVMGIAANWVVSEVEVFVGSRRDFGSNGEMAMNGREFLFFVTNSCGRRSVSSSTFLFLDESNDIWWLGESDERLCFGWTSISNIVSSFFLKIQTLNGNPDIQYISELTNEDFLYCLPIPRNQIKFMQ